MPAVDVRDLVVRYGPVTAVDGASLAAPAGALTAVLGPNGAGKTSTVEVCEGFRRFAAGTVRVLGLDPRRDSAALHARVGVMLQDGGVPSGASARRVLTHAAALYAHPHDVSWLLERLDLARLGRTPFRRLSGGEQQRLKLALALVGRPELVFLDEPTAGLDPHARRLVWELIEELRAAGVTLVLTTHLMDEAERLADHVVLLDRGRVVAAGTPYDLTGTTDDGLAFSAPPALPVAELRAALPERVDVVEESPGRYRVRGPVDPQVLAAVTAWCAGRGVMPQGLTVGRRTLEEVFLELTGRGGQS